MYMYLPSSLFMFSFTERVERILRKKHIHVSVAMKPHQTLRNILFHPKDKGEYKEGVVYTPLTVKPVVRNMWGKQKGGWHKELKNTKKKLNN